MSVIHKSRTMLDSQTNRSSSLQVCFEISNDDDDKTDTKPDNKPDKLFINPVSITEELIYTPLLSNKSLDNTQEVYTYYINTIHHNDTVITTDKEIIKGISPSIKLGSSVLSILIEQANKIQPIKLGTMFEVRYESRNDTGMKSNSYFTTFDRHLIRCSDGIKVPVDFEPVIHDIHASELIQPISGFTRRPKVKSNKIQQVGKNQRTCRDPGVYISTVGDEIAILTYDSKLQQMYYNLYHTRHLLEYDSHTDCSNNTTPYLPTIVPFAKRHFSYWPLIMQQSEITWIHGHWIVIFPLLDMVCCYNPDGTHLSTLPITKITITDVYEGLTMEHCKIAFWNHDQRYYYKHHILIWKLSELLTVMSPLQKPFYVNCITDAKEDDEKIAKLRELRRHWESESRKFGELQHNHIISTVFTINTQPINNTYCYGQWIDSDTLVVQSIPDDGFKTCIESRLFFIRILPILNTSNTSTDKVKDRGSNKIYRGANVSIKTEWNVSLQTKNCYIDREIIMELPSTGRITAKLYTPPSRNHIRFEFECLLTFLQTRTDLFQTLLPVTSLTTLMLQYLF